MTVFFGTIGGLLFVAIIWADMRTWLFPRKESDHARRR